MTVSREKSSIFSLGFVYAYIMYICVYTKIHTHNFCLWQLSLTNINHHQQTKFEHKLSTCSNTIPASQSRAANYCAFAKLGLIVKAVKLITVVPDFSDGRIQDLQYSWKFHIQPKTLPPHLPLDCILEKCQNCQYLVKYFYRKVMLFFIPKQPLALFC